MMSVRELIRNSWLNPLYLTRKLLWNELKRASDYAQGMMIDIGCGDKPYLPLFESRVEVHMGLDLPRPAARSKLVDVFGHGEYLPFKEACFDTVLLTEVLEHVAEPHRLFHEMGRVLKPGGYLILTAPQTWGLHEEPYDFFRFTRYGLTSLAERSAFRVEYVRADSGPWITIGQRASELVGRRGIIVYPLCAVIQLWAWVFDKALRERQTDALNNVLVAQKLGH